MANDKTIFAGKLMPYTSFDLFNHDSSILNTEENKIELNHVNYFSVVRFTDSRCVNHSSNSNQVFTGCLVITAKNLHQSNETSCAITCKDQKANA